MKKTLVTSSNCKDLSIEHKIGVRLSHPNLVKSFCSFYDRANMYLLMEFMEGGTLLERKLEKDDKSEGNRTRFDSPPQKAFRATSRDQPYGSQLT